MTALGETNETFYRNIYTGQQLPLQQRQPLLRPHRPAPMPDFQLMQNHLGNAAASTTTQSTRYAIISYMIKKNKTKTTTTINKQKNMFYQLNRNPHLNETYAGTGWICDLCTFQNKYTQQTCEACTKPFLSAGNQMGYNTNGLYVQSPVLSSSLPYPPMSQPLPPYMSMPIQMHPLPYAPYNHSNNFINNNNNNMPYIYYQPSSMPTQFYPPASTSTSVATDPQSMHSQF